MKLQRFVAVVLAGVLALSAIGCKKEEKTDSKVKLVIATDATWPPMEMVNENKEIEGFDIDFLKAVAEAGGFDVEFQNVAWDGIFSGLDNGKYDGIISSVTITDERKQAMDFSMPYINAGQVLIVKTEEKNIATIADLSGKSIGAQIGTTGAMEIAKHTDVTLKNYDELGFAIEDLANGRIEGVVADTPIAASYVLQNPNYTGKLKIVGEPFTEEYYGIAVKKGNTRVVDLLNAGIEKVLGTEKYKEIEQKWLR